MADDRGRLLGKYQSPFPPLQEQLNVVRDFLISLQKGRLDMSKKSTTEKTNMVFLAGALKFDPKIFDNSVKALIDVGLKSAVQVSIYTGDNKNGELAAKMKRFREGDFIRLVAMLRPYGVKHDDSWRNSMSVDITEIKTDPPQHQEQRRSSPADDDVPF